MRKMIFAAAIIALSFTGKEPAVVPGSSYINIGVIKPEKYEMKWFLLMGKKKIEVASVTDSIAWQNGRLYAVSNVFMKGADAPWTDSTVADSATLRPIRHTSSNKQRDMVLNYGETVTGSYFDKKKNSTQTINDSLKAAYFDSNLYGHLVRWLKLEEGMQLDIAIYNYDPDKKSGLMYMHIEEVKSGTVTTERKAKFDVWIVKVTDDISPGLATVFYINKANRELIQQDIMKGKKRSMIMLRSDL
ncbi:MAG: hypothetical protein ACRC3B_23500 [Bacteroidia bacterium]